MDSATVSKSDGSPDPAVDRPARTIGAPARTIGAPARTIGAPALALLCAAQFVVVLDATIVAVALPAIRRDLGFSHAGLQWVVSAYGLTFGGFLMVLGRAADLYGRRRVFAAGFA